MKTLFEQHLSHTNDPATSYAAAKEMVESGKLNRQEQEIWSAFLGLRGCWGWNGCTAKELARYMSGGNERNYYTIQRRLSGLHNKGKIERTGEKRDGCCVWRLK